MVTIKTDNYYNFSQLLCNVVGKFEPPKNKL